MYTTISPTDMKSLETQYMAEYGIPSILLMEHAAQGVLDAMHRHLSVSDSRAVFLCGPGANGGDGYASARLWQCAGGQSVICETVEKPSGDAGINQTLAEQAGCRFVSLETALTAPHLLFDHTDILVDALFGTGLSRPIEGDTARLIQLAADYARTAGLPVIAVDIPSGLMGATGKAPGPVLPATETVTFHRPKNGLYLNRGPALAGQITVWPIDVPASYGNASGFCCLEERDLPRFLPPRQTDAHKGTFGRTVILAGSPGMAGAAAMCASAAVKAGSGLTTILCTTDLLPILQVLCPAAMCRVLPDLDSAGLSVTEEALATADRAVIGCGLSRNPALLPFLRIFAQARCPVIWDADALHLLADCRDLLPLPEKDVVTPHPGEAAHLLGRSAAEITEDPVSALEQLRSSLGCHVLLKGPRSLMAGAELRALNPVGTPALAKGGSGDILAGLLAALIGRVQPDLPDPLLAAMQCACLIHARAAAAASEQFGEDCVTPEDIIRHIRLA